MSYTPPVGSATNTKQGVIQLAGDLTGTATAPVVANNAITTAKLADGSVTEPKLAVTNTPSASQVLGWDGSNMTWVAPPTGGASLAVKDEGTSLTTGATSMNFTGAGVTATTSGNDITVSISGTTVPDDGTRMLDSFAGATDDDKLTAAIAWQQATSGMPAIRLGSRVHSFNQTRALYSGLKLIGSPAGSRNVELAGMNYVPTRIQLGSAITNGANSWWVNSSGDLYDIYMADFGINGKSSAGAANEQQFLDSFYDGATNKNNIYASMFQGLSFNFMYGVFGNVNRKCAITQVTFTGHWTANNLRNTQFHLGGADNALWMAGYINIGPAGTVYGGTGYNSYQMIFDSLSKTNIGYIFLSALNGWRGLKVSGLAGHGLRFFGGSYEGYKGSNDYQAAPGTVIRLEGGAGAFFSPSVGQGMQNPDAVNEGGLIHMTGGEWTFHAPCFYKGAMPETSAFVYHSGGRLMITGAGVNRGNSEPWAGRPRYNTTSSGPNSGTTSFYCPDMSMITV